MVNYNIIVRMLRFPTEDSLRLIMAQQLRTQGLLGFRDIQLIKTDDYSPVLRSGTLSNNQLTAVGGCMQDRQTDLVEFASVV